MFKRSFFNFEFKVIALMLVILVIVFVTGFLAFFRFSDLLKNISQTVKSDNSLVMIHSLKNDLTELTSIAKTQSLSEDDSNQEKYQIIKGELSKKISDLKESMKNEEGELNFQLLDSLIRDKLVVLDGIVYSEDPFRVQTALAKVIVSLDKVDLTSENNEKQGYKTPEIKKIEEEIDLNLLKQSKEQLEDLSKEESKLQKKLKKAEKRNKNERVVELDSMIRSRKEEAIKIHRALIKSDEFEKDKILTINQIHKGIEGVGTEELKIEKKIKTAQLKLISMDDYLSLKISNVFDEFELIENSKIAKATSYAEKENQKTKTSITVFVCFAGVLLFLMGYIIFQYVKRNNLYKTALKRSNSETDRLVKTRERLMATISHEIRTPMHAISGFAEQLSKENLTSKQQDYLSMIRKSSEHLTYLVNDVLDYSKLQNRKFKLVKSHFDLYELVDDVVMFSKQLVKKEGVAVGFEIEGTVSGLYFEDSFRIRQILLNLMSNAVKFTEKGAVNMTVQLIDQDGDSDTVKFIIKDTGIGIDENDVTKVFDEFEQIENVEHAIKGTGLGLPITKKLIELHKGKITLESEKNVGTTVEVTLKLEKSKEQEVLEKRIEMQPIYCESVLIVDDEEYNRKLLKAILKQYNVQLFEAENGRKALEILSENNVDLILLDARMPVMNGEETIQAIKNLDNKDKRNVKLILLTAAGTESDSLLKEVHGYVSKPFSQEVLIKEINRVCQEKEVTMKSKKEDQNESIDFTNLRTLSGNDKAFYIDMLQTFVSTTSSSHNNMHVAQDNKDWELIANEAHKIASPCRHIGAIKLHKVLKEIEKVARTEQNVKKLKPLIKELGEELSVVLKFIDEELTITH